MTTIFGSARCLAAAAPYFIALLLDISIFVAFLPIAAFAAVLALSIFFCR